MNNPYQSAATPPLSNRELRLQRAVLETYQKYRDRDMPYWDLVALYAKSWILIAVLLMLFLGFFLWLNPLGPVSTTMMTFIFGVMIGRIGRDLSHCKAQTRVWPIIRDVLNWGQIETKLERITNEAASSNPS